jgi:hypothetical protein
MADFKIAKIRFTWKGNWATAFAYVKDDIVRYGAKTYVCMVTHTSSANFYTDLNNATTRWNEMIDGYEWTADWSPTTFYQVNDLAKYGGILYRCTTSHTSGSTLEAGIANWTIHVSTEDWLNTWTATTFYNVNDVVRWGAVVYRCNTAHTSASFTSTPLVPATDYLGLENDLAKWTVIHSGTDWKGIYSANQRYKLGDIVRYNSSIWYCNIAHRSEDTINQTNFTLWLPGLTWEDEWQLLPTYTPGDIVSHGGYVYRAITVNSALVPPANPGDWQLVAEQYRDQGDWVATPTIYKVGDMVRWAGGTYVAIADNLGIEPPNATYWRIAIYTDHFRGMWTEYDSVTDPYNYLVGDIVSFQSNTYICVEKHNASAGNRPDEDFQGIYWQPYVLGSPTNILKILGDMKTYGVTEDGSSIGVTRRAIGNNSELLKTTIDGEANWTTFYQTPKVYYVGPTGTDSGRISGDPLFGQNPDLTFLTIKYACQYIQDNLAARAPATIFVKSGIYYEQLPISVPANVAVVGDELRNPTIRPAAGYETSDMFYFRNATGLRNLTLEGLSGTLGTANIYLTKRPTAGAYASLDPGAGPNDSSVWITTRSPYIQNVTTFGTGCVGVKVDGNLHNGGNKSIVANDFTQVLSDGIGAWVTNNGRSELVSVFTYYNHIGYLAENNGKIRATNGNNSYGDYGAVAEGENPAEIPKTAIVNNRAGEATVGFIYTSGSSAYRYEFSNAGSTYTTATSVISGTGLNAAVTHDEFRDQAIYEIRVAAPGDSSQPGGGGYVGNSGNAQAGNTIQITLSATDANDSGVYVGMEIYITSGLGVGQVGYINSYNSTSKVASVYNPDTGVAGWTHVVPGTTIAASLDTTTAYIITPRTTVAAPSFTPATRNTPSSAAWVAMAYGNGNFVLISTGATTSAVSSDGINWISGGALPASTTWTDVAAGAISGTTYHVAVASGGTQAAYSVNGGTSWTTAALPTSATWTAVAYGNSRFVAVSSGGTATSISTNGTSWIAGGALPSSTWSAITYGNGKFVAVAGGGSATTAAAYSTDGVSWVSATLPSANWTSVAYGNGRFVAVAQGGATAAWSFDGITWTASTLPGSGSWFEIRYGQGTFVAMQGYGASTANVIASSTDGVTWTSRTMLNTQSWAAMAFGNPGNTPIWALAVTGSTIAQSIPGFTQAKVRCVITSGRISAYRMIEPGSGYTSTPVLTITDPNNTGDVTTEIRRGNGALGNPSFSNRGSAYVTAFATISGDGYADSYQTGSYLNVSNLTLLPGPGANLTLATIADQTYSVVSLENITGSVGNFSCRVRVFPSIGTDESPIQGEVVEIREDYSQCRITGHDFLEIGTGTQSETAYPATDLTNLAPENQIVQSGGGRVFYTSTDQDGNFRVGELFQVEQATGVVSINADAFALSGLSELRLGGVTLGGTGATIREFSTDPTFSANSNNIVPTQKAIKAYIASRIGGGGSDLDVNEIQAGSIKFTAPNQIGHIGGSIYTLSVTSRANFTRGVVGTALAMQYFTRSFT